MGTNNSDFYLPVYVINLKERTERRQHIEEQFMAKHAKGCTNSYRQKG